MYPYVDRKLFLFLFLFLGGQNGKQIGDPVPGDDDDFDWCLQYAA